MSVNVYKRAEKLLNFLILTMDSSLPYIVATESYTKPNFVCASPLHYLFPKYWRHSDEYLYLHYQNIIDILGQDFQSLVDESKNLIDEMELTTTSFKDVSMNPFFVNKQFIKFGALEKILKSSTNKEWTIFYNWLLENMQPLIAVSSMVRYMEMLKDNIDVLAKNQIPTILTPPPQLNNNDNKKKSKQYHQTTYTFAIHRLGPCHFKFTQCKRRHYHTQSKRICRLHVNAKEICRTYTTTRGDPIKKRLLAKLWTDGLFDESCSPHDMRFCHPISDDVICTAMKTISKIYILPPSN